MNDCFQNERNAGIGLYIKSHFHFGRPPLNRGAGLSAIYCPQPGKDAASIPGAGRGEQVLEKLTPFTFNLKLKKAA